MKFRRIAKRPTRRAHPLYPVVRDAVIGENLPIAGGNDAKYFGASDPGADLIPFLIPRADVATITAALCQGDTVNRARLNLSFRFPHMRQDRVGCKLQPGTKITTQKGVIQDR